MLKAFKELGELELEGLSDNEKKKKFLETQTIIPNEPSEDAEDANKYREIVINLDTRNETIEIKQGKELFEENREEFFGFDLKASNSSKTFFTSNKWYYHLLTIPHLIYYIKKENLVDDEGSHKFLNFLMKIEEKFYVTNRIDISTRPKKSYLNINKFIIEQKNKILNSVKDEYKRKLLNNDYVSYKKMKNPLAKLMKQVVNCRKLEFIKKDKYFLNIFSLKVNNEYITETKYKNEYIKIVDYILQQRFFDSSDSMVNKNALCGVCNEKKLVTGQIDIPTKFYVTSSPYFFENLNKKNAYKSFGICQNCYQKVMVGIGKIRNSFSNSLFNKLSYYVIPENIDDNINYEEAIELIQDILFGKDKTYEESIKKIRNIKAKKLKMNFLFWFKPERQGAAFVVSDSINDVYYHHLQDIFSKLYSINISLFSFKSSRYKLKFNDIYYLLFPNKNSHDSPKQKLYRKEMLNLLDSILKGKEIDYKYLLRQFNFILRKRYFKNDKRVEEIITHPLKMNVLLSWFNQITAIRGGFKMEEGNSITDIENPDINNFFETHADIYQNNSYRQGLFLLGILMNQVLKEQQKENKSANILDKLSFDGMPVRRVKKFVKDVTEILNIYDKYNVNQILHSQMIDRLQGVESSSLNKDEVVFYILSGVSFGRYLGHKHSKNKEGAN